MTKTPAQTKPAKKEQRQTKNKKLTFIAICRWLPQNKKSPRVFFLNEKGIFYTSGEIKNIQRCYYHFNEVQLLVFDGETLTVILSFLPLMPAEPLVLLN